MRQLVLVWSRLHRDAWNTFTFRQFIVYEEGPRPEFVLQKLVEVGTSNLAAAVLGRLGRPPELSNDL